VLFNSGGKHETMFPIITYYYFSIDQILKIVLSEMETKKISNHTYKPKKNVICIKQF